MLAVDLPRSTRPCCAGCVTIRVHRRWCPGSTAGSNSSARATAATRCSRPASLVVGGLRSLRDLLEVVEYDIADEAAWGDVARADSFADIDTPADATSLGIELPGLA